MKDEIIGVDGFKPDPLRQAADEAHDSNAATEKKKPAKKNLRENWTHIRITRELKELLQAEAKLMRSNAEWTANRMTIFLAEVGRHHDFVTLNDVILALYKYRQNHRKRRDESAKRRKSAKNVSKGIIS
jgi:type II secretory pathway component HofQ